MEGMTLFYVWLFTALLKNGCNNGEKSTHFKCENDNKKKKKLLFEKSYLFLRNVQYRKYSIPFPK